MKSTEAGFTLTELMISIVVGSLVVSFTYTLFVFAERFASNWKRSSDTRQTAERTVRLVASDIECAKSCCEMTDSSLVVLQGLEKTVRYAFGPGKLYRNGDPVSPDSQVTMDADIRRAGKEYQIRVHVKEGRMEYLSEACVRMLESGKEEFTLSKAGE